MAQWHYGSNGGQHGPVEEDELRALIASGGVTPRTLVWREGMTDWVPLHAVPELGGQPSSYQAPGAPNPGYYPAGVANSGLAIASMVCGILALVTFCMFGGILGIPAVICGHLALSQINKSEIPMAGRGIAIAGLITGYLGVLSLIAMIAYMVFVTTQLAPHTP